MPDHTIVPLSSAHIDECVLLHRLAFPDFFLSQLGPHFLAEFYRGFLSDREAVTGVSIDARGQVRGVVVGTLRPEGFFSRLLKRRGLTFALASLGLLVRRPSAAPRLLRALRYRGRVPLAVEGALLSSICVAPDAQGDGVGTSLLRHFEACVRASGSLAYLVTDRLGNEATNAFYAKHGWRLAGSYDTPEGRAMNCYVLDVPGELP